MMLTMKRWTLSRCRRSYAFQSGQGPTFVKKVSGLGCVALIGVAGLVPLPSAAQSLIDPSRAITPASAVSSGAVAVRVVSNDAELQQALQSVKGPTEIRIQPGRYGVMVMRDVEGGGQVTITAADPGNRPVLAALQIRGVSGVNVTNLNFSRHVKKENEGIYLLQITSSADILAENLNFEGIGNRFDLSIYAATLIRSSSNITFQKNYSSYFHHGLELRNVDRITIRLNEFTDMRTDAIRGGGVSDALIENNVATRYHPEPDDHVDGIQLWTTHQTKSARNIFIRDNLVVRDGGGKPQGIFIRDEQMKFPYENLEITGNLLIGTLWHGIAVTNLRGGIVSNNEVISHPTQQSWIKLSNAGDVVMENNKAEVFHIERATGKVTERNNRRNSRTDRGLPQRIREWVATKPGFAEFQGPVLRRLMQE